MHSPVRYPLGVQFGTLANGLESWARCVSSSGAMRRTKFQAGPAISTIPCCNVQMVGVDASHPNCRRYWTVAPIGPPTAPHAAVARFSFCSVAVQAAFSISRCSAGQAWVRPCHALTCWDKVVIMGSSYLCSKRSKTTLRLPACWRPRCLASDKRNRCIRWGGVP